MGFDFAVFSTFQFLRIDSHVFLPPCFDEKVSTRNPPDIKIVNEARTTI